MRVCGRPADRYRARHRRCQLPTEMTEQHFSLSIYNGRVKVYCDSYVMFTFNQIDFKGYYAYKDDTDLYGLDIYLVGNGANHTMEIYFKTKAAWLAVLAILDKNL